MPTRNNILGLLVGAKGKGKTTWIIDHLVKPKFKGKKKTIVLETNYNAKYKGLLVPITLKQLPNWKSGDVFLVCNQSEAEKMLHYIATLPNVWNSTIIFEDATKYIKANLDTKTRASVIDSKQRNTDIFMAFHSLQRVPPIIAENADILWQMKTKDKPSNISKFGSDAHEILENMTKMGKIAEWYYPKHNPCQVRLN